jgi:hypothetical protein
VPEYTIPVDSYQDARQRVFDTRENIKRVLPRLYDLFWAECDRGGYFDYPIGRQRLTRLRPRNMLLRSGSRNIQFSYEHAITETAMALAAEAVASELTEAPLAAYFRFDLRNRYASDAARAFFRLLDQISHHLHEISARRLLPGCGPREASFGNMRKAVRRRKLGGSRRIRGGAEGVIAAATNGLTKDGWRLLTYFRNVDTHRYVVGIDHIAYEFARDDGQTRIEPGGRVFTVGSLTGEHYSLYGRPDVSFGTMGRVLSRCSANAKAIMSLLSTKRLLLLG